MAKKDKVTKNKSHELPNNVLPQNILNIGERVEENKNIYIHQSIYKEIHRFTKNKTTNESGGVLVGSVLEELGKTNIVIKGFIEAKYCEATPTTLKFTHETWNFIHKEIEQKYKGMKIVGWIHTHPDFGIFLSEYDKFIHQNFFGEDHQIAYVVDPIQNIEGFYFWINEKIEKCKGFYIYDKTGTPITVNVEKDEAKASPAPTLFNIHSILTAILAVAVVFLIFSNISTGNQLKKLETRQQTIVDEANRAFSQVFQESIIMNSRIQELESILKEAGIIDETSDTSDTDDATDPDNDGEKSEQIGFEEGGTEQGTNEQGGTDNTLDPPSTDVVNGSETIETTEGDSSLNE